MLQTCKLLLPIFIPSWKFFNRIAPSPRIEFTLLSSGKEDSSCIWQEFSLRPNQISTIDFIKSIFYNPRWNEALFISNCAERLVIDPNEYCVEEITKRIRTKLEHRGVDLKTSPYLQFRLIFISREGNELQKEILFTSEIKNIFGDIES